MIKVEDYERLLNDGLILDHYYVMLALYQMETLPKNKRVQGFVNLLTKRGYIEDGLLTEKGIDFVQELCDICSTTTTTTQDPEGKSQLLNLDWTLALHKRCEEKLFTLTGRKQVRDKISGKPYSFLCNPVDLHKNVTKIVKLYKIDDLIKVERAIMRHIEECHKAKSWFPILFYYIFKDNKSQLVTDLENLDNGDTDITTVKTDYATEG